MSTPTIAQALKGFADKTLSPRELVHDCLDRAERLNPVIHAFIRFTREAAMVAAAASEARWMAGTPMGPLDGIPIAHKDIYETAGVPTTAHSRVLLDNTPAEDAAVVRMWKQAGAISLGKLATHEFAWGGPSFDLPWPPARNPWDITRFTGGSSSGTGAAVAAGVILGGTGSDTGGSIRMPGALCGVAGIKPTYGLCSRTGVLPLASSLDTTGPLAWTVEDCARLLQAMVGHDPRDPSSADRPAPDVLTGIGDGVKGLRVGVVRHFHETDLPVSAPMQGAIDAAIAALRAAGAEIGEATLPSLDDFAAAGWLILASEAFAIHEPWLRTRYRDYGEFLRERLAVAATISGADYIQAQRRRRELNAVVTGQMQRFDILLTAAAPGEARPIEQMTKWTSFEGPNFTMPFNLTGQPALAVNGGFSPSGLPLGVQLVGRAFEDATVLRAGHAVEQALALGARRPKLPV